MNRRTILAALALVAMAGCQKESAADLAATSAAVQFSSESLAMRTETLNGADAWSPGDAVGIFTDGFAVERANVEYTADIVAASATTSFKVANSGEEILYPNFNDVDVTFSAYYPYQAAATASDITIDISGQKDDLGSVDFMCGSFSWLKASDNHDTAVAFTFGHKLAKVILNITAGDTMAGTLANIQSATLTGINTKASYLLDGTQDRFSLSEPGSVELNYVAYTDEIIVTAILHPGDCSGSQLIFNIGGEMFTTSFDQILAADNIYTYDIILGYDKVDYLGLSSISAWGTTTPSGTLATNKEDGTERYPFLISSAEEVKAIGGGAYNGMDYSLSACYLITEDIDLEGDAENQWDPIGAKTSSDTQFTGTIDGDGHTISGFYYYGDYNNAYYGFIGILGSGGHITNLTVEGSFTLDILSYGYSIYTGGVAGNVVSTAKVTNCTNKIALTFSGLATYACPMGGIAGNNSGTIQYCRNQASISSISYSGGIVGYNYGSIDQSYNEGSLTAVYNSGAINCGGIAGTNGTSSSSGTVTRCYNTAASISLTGVAADTSNNIYIGGVVGYLRTSLCSITATYSTSTIRVADAAGSATYLGALVGYSAGPVSYSYAMQEVSSALFGTTATGHSATTCETFSTGADITAMLNAAYDIDYWINGTSESAPILKYFEY